MVKDGMPLLRGRWLVFEVEATDVKKPYSVYWKVRNCGEEAYRRKMVRGEIWADGGKRKRGGVLFSKATITSNAIS